MTGSMFCDKLALLLGGILPLAFQERPFHQRPPAYLMSWRSDPVTVTYTAKSMSRSHFHMQVAPCFGRLS